jgi:hypothetical protein
MEAGTTGPSGAAAINTLGFGLESIYKIKRTFAHDRSFLWLTFFGELKEQINDESWGLDNVRIEVQ